jgi:hypothetical protein
MSTTPKTTAGLPRPLAIGCRSQRSRRTEFISFVRGHIRRKVPLRMTAKRSNNKARGRGAHPGATYHPQNQPRQGLNNARRSRNRWIACQQRAGAVEPRWGSIVASDHFPGVRFATPGFDVRPLRGLKPSRTVNTWPLASTGVVFNHPGARVTTHGPTQGAALRRCSGCRVSGGEAPLYVLRERFQGH